MTRVAIALLVGIPVAALLWFEVIYLLFGLTGEDAGTAVDVAIALLSLAATLAWSLHGAAAPADAASRASRLGIAVSMALPIVSIAVLLIWTSAEGRRDLGMGGLMLYSMPVVAFIACIVLVVLFGTVRRVAGKRIVNPARLPHQS